MLERSAQRLLRFARSLQRAEDFGELVAAAAQEVREALTYAHTWLLIAEDETLSRLRLIAYEGSRRERVWEVAPVLEVRGDAFLEALTASDEPLVVEDARLDARTHKPTVEALQNRTMINIPLALLDKPLGFLGVGTFGDEGCRLPTPAELDYLVGLANQLAVACARVRYAEERQRNALEKLELERRIARMQRLESLGILAGGVAHDFNNLLTVIMSGVSLAQSSTQDADVLADLESAQSAAHRARDLTTQLLAMSRGQPLRLQLVDINTRVAELSSLLQRVFPENITTLLDLTPNLPPVEGDTTQLDRVLMNLSINARDAMPEGGRLSIATEWVELKASFVEAHPWAKCGQYVLITISDSGIGMSKETLERLFEPFFTTKSAEGGTGLGLAVAFGIVAQHGGLLHPYSEQSVGTTFKVYLPVAPENVVRLRSSRPAPAAGGGNEQILMAEDDPDVRAMTRRILQSFGYQVTCVSERGAAVRSAEAQPFDLFLLDVVMPGPSCEDTVTQLARMQPNASFLLTSGYAAGTKALDLARALNLRVLTKPYDPDSLLGAIRGALSRKRR